MLLTKKNSGDIKRCLVYNWKNTRNWILREDKSSPTVLTESLMLISAVNAHEGRDVMTLDIPNAYIQADVPEMKKGEKIGMKDKLFQSLS